MNFVMYSGKSDLSKNNRPNKDPKKPKGLYYRPMSLSKDPLGSTAKHLFIVNAILL
jgi:hypothetical protein